MLSLLRSGSIWRFFLNCRASEPVLDLAKMSHERLHEVLGEESALRGPHAVPKPEIGDVIEMKDENEGAVLHGHTRPVKRSRRE